MTLGQPSIARGASKPCLVPPFGDSIEVKEEDLLHPLLTSPPSSSDKIWNWEILEVLLQLLKCFYIT